jgi:hypothetical protein
VLLLLLLPSMLVPAYCLAVGTRANSLAWFTRAISQKDAHGALQYLTLADRAGLVLRMTTTPLPQARALGVPIAPRNVQAAIVAVFSLSTLVVCSQV